MKRLLIIVVVVPFLAWTVLSALTQVRPGERAVVFRNGGILEDKPAPGLFIGLPWGIDVVERVRVTEEKRVVVGLASKGDEGDMGGLLTGDHNLVNVEAEINYMVIEDQVDKYVLHRERADALITRAAESVLAEWIAGRDVDFVLLNKMTLPPHLIAEVQARVDAYDIGVRIVVANINRLGPPDDVKDAFDRVAQAHTAIGTRINQAEQTAFRTKRDADGTLAEIGNATASYQNEQLLQARADAEVFTKRLEQYRKLAARDAGTLNAMWQDEMTRLYRTMEKAGRIDVLDHYLTSEGLNISQFPLAPKKKN